jgi:hypothetical protein
MTPALLVLVTALAGVLATAPAVAQPPPPPFFGPQDLDHSGYIDGHDFALFFQAFIAYRDTQTIINDQADFNDDKRIDYYDAMVMVEAYLSANH